ncbi:ABC transporter substrate-binding protein [Nocardia sp. CDC159]|uniref:ABC transporter substrate-binding protein n=1 Tax=Nocardia pulmonis TaxID=2951408 RepID=A0A9X2E189_9NOCA|nr:MULTISPECIES: ABC transporter substrate-binding protein [Nocardia]MCM6772304.1 ABC transporter substrate-binding protein [Nocardia pulmonis]MCM6785038.1 ABC transporter substrate-binding protein [Nocardia sp. CDC159]
MRTTLVAAALVGALTLALTGCVESGRTDSSRSTGPAVACPVPVDETFTGSVRIGYQDIPNGDLIVKDTGLLDTCLPNGTFTWSKFSSGADVIQAFGANSLDIGLLGSAALARALSAPLRQNLRAIWIHDVIGTAESLVAKDPAITSVAGLRGKRIAVPFASTAHYSLLAALSAAGIDKDVRLVNLTPDAILGAWKGDQIDAAFIWEPTLSQLLTDGHVVTSAAATAQGGKPTYDLAGARADFVSANPEFLAVWTAVQDWAVGQINGAPAEAAAHIAAQLGVPVDAVRKQLAGYSYPGARAQAGPEYLGGQLGEDLRGTAEFLLGQGEVQGVAGPEVYSGASYSDAARVSVK